MALSNQTVKQGYQGNGVTTSFAITFTYFNETEVQVIRRNADGSETTLVAGALQDYTLTGASPPTTPLSTTVTMNAAPASTVQIWVVRKLPLTQTAAYVDNSAFPAATHELALDRLAAEIQQTNEKVARALLYEITTPTTPGTLPEPQATSFMGYDGSLVPVNYSPAQIAGLLALVINGVKFTAQLKAITSANRFDFIPVYNHELDAFFYYDSSSSTTADDNLVIAPNDNVGRWLRLGTNSPVLTGPIVTNYVDIAESSTPAAPAAGYSRLFATTLGFFRKTAASVVLQLATLTGTETLTNKTLDADLNTITNLVDADIKASAAIARTKMANGSLGQVVVNDPSTGALSSQPVNTFMAQFATTVAANATRVLVATSSRKQYFTGTVAGQIVQLPDPSTLVNGQDFIIVNLSTQVLSTQTNDTTSIQGMAAQSMLVVTCTNILGGTGLFAWSWQYFPVLDALLPVTAGGTGLASITAHGMIVGNGSSTPTVVAPDSSTTKVWTSGGSSADPSWQPSSGGGGGGGGANWQTTTGLAPTEDYEFDEKVWEFQQTMLQSLTLWVKVPNSYVSGNPLTVKGGFYSLASSNKFKFQVIGTLIRAGTDAIDSTTNQSTVNSGDITNTVAKQLRTLSFAVTANGQINSVAISAGDIVKLVLSRIASSATEDSTDTRFIPSSTEVLFA